MRVQGRTPHLLLSWRSRIRLAAQAAELDAALASTGGLASYVSRARQLLEDSKNDKNPFEGFTPSVPEARAPARARCCTQPRRFAPWTVGRLC
jgi:hypothetical protein